MITLLGKIKNIWRRTVLSQKDFSGYVIAPGQVLDLGGQTVTAAKEIICRGKIRNGRINYSGPKHSAAINVPKGSRNVWIDGITVQGGSYNGLAKVWANGTNIKRCEVLKGTGWAVQVLGADRVKISGLKTKDLRRGGIYFGDGTAYGTKTECVDCLVEDCTLDRADEEAVFRANTVRNLVVVGSTFDNTRSRSGKEAVQLRGRSGVITNCNIYGSTSTGQTPNGQKQNAVFTFGGCTIYGYNSIEAGGAVTFTDCTLVNRPTYDGRTLKTPGNGCVVNPQSAARELPEGRATLKDCVVNAKAITVAPKRVKMTNVRLNGKAVK